MSSDPSGINNDQNILLIRNILEEALHILEHEDVASSDLINEAQKIAFDPKLFGPFLKKVIQTRKSINDVAVNAGIAREVVTFVYNIVLDRQPDQAALDAFSTAITRGEMNFGTFAREIVLSAEAQRKEIEKTKQIYDNVFDHIQRDIWEGRTIFERHSEFSQKTQAIPAAMGANTPVNSDRLIVDQAELPELIRIIYTACLGRTPSDDEIGIWVGHVAGSSVSVVEFCRMISESEEATNYRDRLIVDQDELPDLITIIYKACLGRTPGDDEIGIWVGHVAGSSVSAVEFCRMISESEEAINYRDRLNQIAPELTDARFTQIAYEALLERGAAAPEIASWVQQISSGQANRMQMLSWLFAEYVLDHTVRPIPENNPYEVYLMGTDKKINAFDWKKDLETLKHGKELDGDRARALARDNSESQFTFNIKKKKTIVTAIASLYKGGDYIDDFLTNMTRQSIFKDYAELIIIDANSPENESVIIEKFVKDFPNIKYKRYDYRVGIYDAWNIGIEASEGQFLTNTNMDDVRRQDSLERQAAALLALPFVDVVYQDFYYAFDKNVDYDDIAFLGAKSKVGMVTPHTMFTSNPPHNAPMWRKSLHDELGLFDGTYKSAGDYEFWMRCLAARKVFYKLNDPHATYFQNPHGLSTSRETPGIVESKRITKKYGRKVIPDIFTCSAKDFLKHVGANGDAGDIINPSDRYDYIQTMLEKAAFDLKYKAISEQGN